MTIQQSLSIGELATQVDTTISIDATIEEALALIRNKTVHHSIVYFYVVDHQQHLVGVVSARQLLLSPLHQKVSDVMQSWVAKLKVNQTIKDALELFDRHPLLALPVVDHEGKLLGAVDVQMVTHEKVNWADQHNRAALFQMIGITLEDEKKSTVWHNYSRRMPWLLCNVFSGLVCAMISRFYEHVLAQFLILTFFIPLVLTLSESISMQSMAQSLQLLRRPRFSWHVVVKKLFQDGQVVTLLALTSSFLMILIALSWGGNFGPALAIGGGVLCSILSSALFGTLLPVFFHRMKLDPKVASGPMVLMTTDILTMTLYLSLALYILC